MELALENKIAIVTGAGSQIGFGKTIALTLAKEGCEIITADIDLNGAEKTANEIKGLGRRSIALKVDVSRKSQVEDMIKQTLAEFGHIDILVNNAGASTPPRPFLEMTEEDCDRDLDINLKGVINCTRAVLPSMIQRKYARSSILLPVQVLKQRPISQFIQRQKRESSLLPDR
jgi:NAD(P)-dependent dehydrogenase (short-subunit alcohol dehydrogenase family)